VDFLSKEFDGVPEDLKAVSLKQLEQVVREISMRMNMSDNTIHDFTLHRLCGKIFGVVDFLQRFKKALQDEQVK
jgi:hypothetical protein